jgi:excinuclease ABC subunit C
MVCMNTSSDAFPESLAKGRLIIQETARLLPETPGVYRMLNPQNEVLYVGKAKNLMKRVLSYTQADKLSRRLQHMVAQTTRMEMVHTQTEAEALLLETNLIKKFAPRYNILFRDGKTLPYIFLSEGAWPSLVKRRKNSPAKGTYFGPFASIDALQETLLVLYKAFLLRSCPDTVFANRKRPCLQYHIKRCSAPCVKKVTPEAYGQAVQQAHAVLLGKSKEVQTTLVGEMELASAAQAYERAALLRNRIQALTKIQAHQSIYTQELKDGDVLGLAYQAGVCCIQVFFFRNGGNYGTQTYFPKQAQDEEPLTVFQAFIAQFYAGGASSPLVLLSHPIPEMRLLEEALNLSMAASAEGPPPPRMKLQVPKQGIKQKIVQQALHNAEEALGRHLAQRESQRAVGEKLATLFGLKRPPQRIEVYDNSHLQGTHAFGAMIVATPEGFLKKAYRKFKIQQTKVGDDFQMMREVMERRFKKSVEKDPHQQSLEWPELLIVDGGKGQLSAAGETLATLGLHHIPLVAMAKGPDRNAGHEVFYQAHTAPLQLDFKDPVLYYLQRLRDEAHRYAISAHRQKRLKKIRESGLEAIPGVGKTRKKLLIRYLGSLEAVRCAGVEDLQAIPGIHSTLARKIFAYFQSNVTKCME